MTLMTSQQSMLFLNHDAPAWQNFIIICRLFTVCVISWWRHQMETFSALLALCAGNSPVPVNSPHKGQWRGSLKFSLIYAWINDWINNREAGDLRRHCGHYDVIVMFQGKLCDICQQPVRVTCSTKLMKELCTPVKVILSCHSIHADTVTLPKCMTFRLMWSARSYP